MPTTGGRLLSTLGTEDSLLKQKEQLWLKEKHAWPFSTSLEDAYCCRESTCAVQPHTETKTGQSVFISSVEIESLVSAWSQASLKKHQRGYNLRVFQLPKHKASQSMLNRFFSKVMTWPNLTVFSQIYVAYKSHSHQISNLFKTMGSSPNSNAKSSIGQRKRLTMRHVWEHANLLYSNHWLPLCP